MTFSPDNTDLEILNLLQRDSSANISEIAAKVGLSRSACHRRIRLLEDAKIITGYSADIDLKRLGYALTFVVEVSLEVQGDRAMEEFEAQVVGIPEVQSCQLMTGGPDYQMRVVAKSVDDFERIHHLLANLCHVSTLRSALQLRSVKASNYIQLGNPTPFSKKTET